MTAALSGLLAVLALVVLGAPAHAATAPVKFTSPADQEVLKSGQPTVRAFLWFGPTGGLGRRDVKLTLESLDHPDHPPVEMTQEIDGGTCVPVTFNVKPALAYNGKYRATIDSEAPLGALGTPSEQCSGADSTPRVFFGAAPPVAPTGLNGSVSGRSVLLRWDANPERDVVKYRVLRAKGTGGFEEVGTPDKPLFNVNADEGGEQRFQVVALRQGAKKGDPLVESSPSPVFGTDIPPPAAATPGIATPNAGRRLGAPSASVSRPKPFVPPDTGFRQTLPFAQSPELVEEGEEAAVPPAQVFEEIGVEEEGTDDKRNLAVLAAGLLVTVLVMHLLWVKGEVDREPLEAIGTE